MRPSQDHMASSWLPHRKRRGRIAREQDLADDYYNNIVAPNRRQYVLVLDQLGRCLLISEEPLKRLSAGVAQSFVLRVT